MPRPAPAASPVLMPVPATAVPADESLPGWLWALIGAGATALAIGAVWALRRSRVIAEDAAEEPYEPVAPPPAPPRPAPVAPTPPRAPTPAPASIPPAPASRASEPFEIALQPAGITLSEREVVLEFELLVGNLQDITAENVRPQLGLMSAHPDQDREIGAFHANSVLGASNQPFDLPARGGGRMPVRLALARDRVHVVQVGGRPMFVPIVMLDLRWRSGISIRRFGADFMVGTAGQGGKVGPIWLDRPSVTGPLAATRYRLRQVAAA